MFAATGAEIVAVDISEELLAIARQKSLPPNQVQFVCGRFEGLELDAQFDVVIGSSVLHHLDVPAALVSIRRLLKPGGIMSFAEPNMLNPQVWLERHPFLLKRWFQYVSPDETAFVRWSLARSLEGAGFVDPIVTPFDWLHPASPAPLIPLIQSAGRALEHLPGVREFAGSLLIRCRRSAGAALDE